MISDSGACAIVCEDAAQLAKIAAIREQLPHLRTIIVIDPPAGGRATRRPSPRSRRSRSRSRARAGPLRRGARGAPRSGAPRGPVHVHLHLRHHRPAEGLRAHATATTARSSTWSSERRLEPTRGRGLSVPAARALVRAADPAGGVRPRRHAGLLRWRHQADRGRADGGQTDLPAVGAARVREDLHARPRRDRSQAARGAGAGAPGGDRTRHEGARHDGPRRAGARGAAGAVRGGRRAALQERARDLRRARAPGRQRRRADRQGDPRILLRLRRAGAGGLRHDRDRHRRHRLARSRTTASARSASRCRASS